MRQLTLQHLWQVVAIPLLTAALSSYVTVQILARQVAELDGKVSTLDLREQRHYEDMQLSFRQLYQLISQRRSW